jgi:hypothetical protein
VTAIEPLLLRHRIAAAIAAVAAVSVSLLAWLGYVAVREWQQSVSMLAERGAEEASEVLLTGMTRDMRAVQRSVLASPALDPFALRPPYEVINLVAGAFGRYRYPESFFLWRSEAPASGMFMHRRNRPPPWARPVADRNQFPLTVESNPSGLPRLLDRVRLDARNRRRFSVFETSMGEVPYQVVARLFYRDELALELDAVFGFVVNLDWVRQNYFAELLREDVWTRGARAGDRGRTRPHGDEHGAGIGRQSGSQRTTDVSAHLFQPRADCGGPSNRLVAPLLEPPCHGS